MFTPEYTVTSKTIKNIALIEYGRAVIDNTVILQNWEKQLKAQAVVEEIYANLQLERLNFTEETIKRAVDNLYSAPLNEVTGLKKAIESINEAGSYYDLNESNLKTLHGFVAIKNNYRQKLLPGKTRPEEILAEVVELFDWLNTLDAKDSHPVFVAAIAKARLEQIAPFEQFNTTAIGLLTNMILIHLGYSLRGFVSFSSHYQKGNKEYGQMLSELNSQTHDYTKWIEYFSQGIAMETAHTQEKVKLLAKDTKVAKVTGRIKLTDRQEKIVEYLQDYGILQNKDFPRIFPQKSEDSILRDLKALIDQGLVQKVGSTKSSRYELR